MGKLVRDRIPEIIRASGGVPVVRVLDHGEYRTALLEKLVEEAKEARSSEADGLLEEMGDIYEVLRATCAAYGWTIDDVETAASVKAEERGAFEGRLYLS